MEKSPMSPGRCGGKRLPTHVHRHQRADQQVGIAILGDDAVYDDDERAGWPADLHTRAAQRGDNESGDDRSEDACFRFCAGGNCKGDGQWQGDHADGKACGDIGEEARFIVAVQCVDQTRAKVLRKFPKEPIVHIGCVSTA